MAKIVRTPRKITCPKCQGNKIGTMTIKSPHAVETIQMPCPACQGEGYLLAYPTTNLDLPPGEPKKIILP